MLVEHSFQYHLVLHRQRPSCALFTDTADASVHSQRACERAARYKPVMEALHAGGSNTSVDRAC